MFQPNGSTIECDTCVASNTSACSECIVSFVLANDAGPIEYVPAPEPVEIRPADHAPTDHAPTDHAPTGHDADTDAAAVLDRAVELFVRAGLVDLPVAFVSMAEFESGLVLEPLAGATRR